MSAGVAMGIICLAWRTAVSVGVGSRSTLGATASIDVAEDDVAGAHNHFAKKNRLHNGLSSCTPTLAWQGSPWPTEEQKAVRSSCELLPNGRGEHRQAIRHGRRAEQLADSRGES
jgi:hypothetical protein